VKILHIDQTQFTVITADKTEFQLGLTCERDYF